MLVWKAVLVIQRREEETIIPFLFPPSTQCYQSNSHQQVVCLQHPYVNTVRPLLSEGNCTGPLSVCVVCGNSGSCIRRTPPALVFRVTQVAFSGNKRHITENHTIPYHTITTIAISATATAILHGWREIKFPMCGPHIYIFTFLLYFTHLLLKLCSNNLRVSTGIRRISMTYISVVSQK